MQYFELIQESADARWANVLGVLGGNKGGIDMVQGSNLAVTLLLTQSINLDGDVATLSEMVAEPCRRSSTVA